MPNLWFDSAKLIADTLVGIAWPAGVVILVLLFKNDLRKLIPRVKKFGLDGIEVGSEAQQQSPTKELSEVNRTSLNSPQSSQVLQAAEIQLRNEIAGLPADAQVEKLIRHAALMQVSGHFESVYANIFGSQIRALQALNASQTTTEAEAKTFFETEAVEKNPEAYANFGFDRWIQFLTNGKLVDHANGMYSITPLGSEFLKFLAGRHYRTDKPF